MTPHQSAAPAQHPTPARASGATATVRITLLGPVAVQAPGPIAADKLAGATEIAVALALHPDGVHEAVLRASIWPRGVSDDVFDAALGEVVDWLGSGPDGRPCVARIDGAWQLADAVAVDWDELRHLAAIAAGPDELSTLLRAIELIQGRAFSATPPGRYGWLAFARAAREARVVGTAVTRRAAALLLEHDRPDDAEAVLRRGLRLVPAAELLWRDLLHLVGSHGSGDTVAASAVADEMYETLHALRVWPEPETDALVEQLAPGRTPSSHPAPQTA
jgi:hypothetical protein